MAKLTKMENKILHKANMRLQRLTVDFDKEHRIKYIKEVLSDVGIPKEQIEFTDKGYISTKSKIQDYTSLSTAIPTKSSIIRSQKIISKNETEKLSEDEIRSAMRHFMQRYFSRYYEELEELSDPYELERIAEEEGYKLDVKKVLDKLKELGSTYRQTGSPIDLYPIIQETDALAAKVPRKDRLK